MLKTLFVSSLLIATLTPALSAQDQPVFISGINPQLAHSNTENEVGIGAVVPWADSLWTNTYGPHLPHGSSDKLRQIDHNWRMIERPESVGGTPANRMIHRETNQLLIGHHLIDDDGNVRTIDPRNEMPGRITANARHLTDPANKVYYLTMENGVYEVDVRTLDVNDIIRDPINIKKTFLPGYHGKGAYTGSGRVVVSNNGEPDQSAPSGCLASWDGEAWTIVARNQFTEVTGPGGLTGNQTEDRVWAVGWDAKSIRLFVLENGKWSKFRLPKGSYTHDANHGWNTEWPRIRKLTDDLTLMHMHGLFFDFPPTFSRSNSAGIKPICTYVKMPVDYAWFNGKLVIGKDDASRFDNSFVQQSQSNLWVGEIDDLSEWGPRNGFGGVWLNESFDAGEISEPFLINGFRRFNLHLQHRGGFSLPVELQIDRQGDGNWEVLRTIVVEKTAGYVNLVETELDAEWIRLVAKGAADQVTAYFQLTSPYPARSSDAAQLFNGLAGVDETAPAGATLQLPRGLLMKLNAFTADQQFQVDKNLNLAAVESTESDMKIADTIAIAQDQRVGVDNRSAFVFFQDAGGRQVKLRLPKGPSAFDETVGHVRHIREVVTERSMLNLHGTFYELPRPRPGRFINFWQMKPICSHQKHIFDFCSWRGMLVFSGARTDYRAPNQVANDTIGIWLGEVDDLWKMGQPKGQGGPWLNSEVKQGVPSDPYLALGYDRKTLMLSHAGSQPVTFKIQVDFLGTGEFATYQSVTVEPGDTLQHTFPTGFAAHWFRLVPDSDTTATAVFDYQ